MQIKTYRFIQCILNTDTLRQAKKRFREYTAHRSIPSTGIGFPNDFVALIASLITTSLNARGEATLDYETVAAEGFTITKGAWPVLQQLITHVHAMLNETVNETKDASTPRLLDQPTLRAAYQRFQETQHSAPSVT